MTAQGGMLRRIAAASVWWPGALAAEPEKYRPLKRLWLPMYDVIALINGFLAVFFGSRLLDRIFGQTADVVGLLFAGVALVCLIGVSFPRLWRVEFVGKVLLIGMVVGYIVCILAFPSPEQLELKEAPSFFVSGMLVFGLPLACFGLDLLTREEFDRRVRRRVKELRDA